MEALPEIIRIFIPMIGKVSSVPVGDSMGTEGMIMSMYERK